MPPIDGAAATEGAEPQKPAESGTAVKPGEPDKTGASAAAGNGLPEAFATAIAGLDADNREWLGKQGFDIQSPEGLAKLAKHVHAQDKLIGGSIRIPGKDATPEEREAFLNRLGRPEKPDAYDFAVPKELPPELPYDGDRAGAFKAVAHKLGLTKEQAAGVHDWYVGTAVEDFGKASGAAAERMAQTAEAETAKLVKLWGPLDGETFKANLEFGHRLITEVGGSEVEASLKARGLVGEDGVILDAPLAAMFAKVGAALYKEGDVLKGDAARVNNPFADATVNMTEQMRVVRQDPSLALSLIAAAGKKPEDFGLKRPT